MTVPPPEMYPVELVLEYAPADGALRVEDLAAAIRLVLAAHDVEPGTGVTLVLTSDEQVRALNLAYRGVDAPTDILSFPAEPLPEEILGHETPEDDESEDEDDDEHWPRPPFRGDMPPELTEEDEAILDRVWAEIAEEDRQAEIGNVSFDDEEETDFDEADLEDEALEGPEEAYEAPYLGDLIVAYPYTARQAAKAGHTLADEFTLLVVHGTLHLLGYDHDTAENQDRMWAKQAELLAALGVTGITVEYFNFGDEADA
jgi:probable rRNA maturation factor